MGSSAGACTVLFFCSQHPVFCSWIFRHGIGFFWPLHISVQNFPKLRRHSYFSVPYTFSVFRCSRRGASRGKFCSKGSQVPGCLRKRANGGSRIDLQHIPSGSHWAIGETGLWKQKGESLGQSVEADRQSRILNPISSNPLELSYNH